MFSRCCCLVVMCICCFRKVCCVALAVCARRFRQLDSNAQYGGQLLSQPGAMHKTGPNCMQPIPLLHRGRSPYAHEPTPAGRANSNYQRFPYPVTNIADRSSDSRFALYKDRMEYKRRLSLEQEQAAYQMAKVSRKRTCGSYGRNGKLVDWKPKENFYLNPANCVYYPSGRRRTVRPTLSAVTRPALASTTGFVTPTSAIFSPVGTSTSSVPSVTFSATSLPMDAFPAPTSPDATASGRPETTWPVSSDVTTTIPEATSLSASTVLVHSVESTETTVSESSSLLSSTVQVPQPTATISFTPDLTVIVSTTSLVDWTTSYATPNTAVSDADQSSHTTVQSSLVPWFDTETPLAESATMSSSLAPTSISPTPRRELTTDLTPAASSQDMLMSTGTTGLELFGTTAFSSFPETTTQVTGTTMNSSPVSATTAGTEPETTITPDMLVTETTYSSSSPAETPYYASSSTAFAELTSTSVRDTTETEIAPPPTLSSEPDQMTLATSTTVESTSIWETAETPTATSDLIWSSTTFASPSPTEASVSDIASWTTPLDKTTAEIASSEFEITSSSTRSSMGTDAVTVVDAISSSANQFDNSTEATVPTPSEETESTEPTSTSRESSSESSALEKSTAATDSSPTTTTETKPGTFETTASAIYTSSTSPTVTDYESALSPATTFSGSTVTDGLFSESFAAGTTETATLVSSSTPGTTEVLISNTTPGTFSSGPNSPVTQASSSLPLYFGSSDSGTQIFTSVSPDSASTASSSSTALDLSPAVMSSTPSTDLPSPSSTLATETPVSSSATGTSLSGSVTATGTSTIGPTQSPVLPTASVDSSSTSTPLASSAPLSSPSTLLITPATTTVPATSTSGISMPLASSTASPSRTSTVATSFTTSGSSVASSALTPPATTTTGTSSAQSSTTSVSTTTLPFTTTRPTTISSTVKTTTTTKKTTTTPVPVPNYSDCAAACAGKTTGFMGRQPCVYYYCNCNFDDTPGLGQRETACPTMSTPPFKQLLFLYNCKCNSLFDCSNCCLDLCISNCVGWPSCPGPPLG